MQIGRVRLGKTDLRQSEEEEEKADGSTFDRSFVHEHDPARFPALASFSGKALTFTNNLCLLYTDFMDLSVQSNEVGTRR